MSFFLREAANRGLNMLGCFVGSVQPVLLFSYRLLTVCGCSTVLIKLVEYGTFNVSPQPSNALQFFVFFLQLDQNCADPDGS